jgi:hypothetical protein
LTATQFDGRRQAHATGQREVARLQAALHEVQQRLLHKEALHLLLHEQLQEARHAPRDTQPADVDQVRRRWPGAIHARTVLRSLRCRRCMMSPRDVGGWVGGRSQVDGAAYRPPLCVILCRGWPRMQDWVLKCLQGG